MKDAGMIFYGQGQAGASTAAGLDDALDSVADIRFFSVPENIQVYEIGIRVTVGTAANAFAVDFLQRPLFGATTGETLIGTITSAATQVADKVVRKLVNFTLKKGDLVRVTVTDAGAASTAGIVYMKAYPAGQGLVEPVDVESAT